MRELVVKCAHPRVLQAMCDPHGAAGGRNAASSLLFRLPGYAVNSAPCRGPAALPRLQPTLQPAPLPRCRDLGQVLPFGWSVKASIRQNGASAGGEAIPRLCTPCQQCMSRLVGGCAFGFAATSEILQRRAKVRLLPRGNPGQEPAQLNIACRSGACLQLCITEVHH